MRESNRLTAMKVSRINRPGRYGDGLGLWLQVSKWSTKAWLFRYTREGRARSMGLGAVHTVSLAEARETARHCRKQLRDGIDPIEARAVERMAARIEAAKGTTFKDCAEAYIRAHEAGWKNAVHRRQWPSTLQAYVYPVIGDLSVAAIDTALVLKVLEPIWTEKSETATRVRGRIEAVLRRKSSTTRASKSSAENCTSSASWNASSCARRALARISHREIRAEEAHIEAHGSGD